MRKKIYFSIIALMVSLAVGAQTREYVDLGLPSGTLWATCNVGANAPEEYGDYFAWGETEPKKKCSKKNYKWCSHYDNNYTWISKYRCQKDAKSDFVDGKYILDPEDDAATVNWGSEWCMPTTAQLVELMDSKYTTTKSTTQNGVRGLLITSNKDKTKSIFLPGAGVCYESGVSFDGSIGKTYYWSNKCLDKSAEPYFAYSTNHISHNPYMEINTKTSRWYGCSVRPVRAKIPVKEYVDLGLPSGTLWATCNVGASAPEQCGDYFAWGETEPKDDYWWPTYKWQSNVTTSYVWINKYRAHIDDTSRFMDNKFSLDPEDDAATANWGSEWCMPTFEQQRELEDPKYTTKKWTTVNGVNGILVTSKKDKTKSIFLPAAGKLDVSIVGNRDYGISGYYWSIHYYSSFADAKYGCASKVKKSGLDQEGGTMRCDGCSVRPVRAKVTTSIVEVTDNQKATKSRKYISGGNLVIVKDGKKYNANGIEIK